jgi:nucleotide-binding universal stress UspA family protein
MSSHGRSGLSRMLIGSVTDKVLRMAPCPVLVVPLEKEN